ncbi:MAG: hypothetical protein JO314_07675 [Acidobacteria bacterium]|nr:hypothetical protein [Acidobacteriota bacterium]
MKVTNGKPDKISRRNFLSRLVAAGFGSSLIVSVRPSLASFTGPESYNVLVVGDSLMWGQGLREQDKAYSLVADWLRHGAFDSQRVVELKVKAHSGSTLRFHSDDAEKYRRIGRDENFYYKPELNIGPPSIWKQLETADAEYRSAASHGADLILIAGSAPDVAVDKILDPSGDDTILRDDIERYCHRDMVDVLRFAAEKNPAATVAVLGYYPMISSKTSSSRLLNADLELKSFPHLLKPLINNPLFRSVYFKKLRRKAQRRSGIWAAESTKALRAAVDELNKQLGENHAVFVPSPVNDDNTFETPNSLLFGFRGSHTDDPLYSERSAQCRETLPRLKKEADIVVPLRFCENAAIGHPNPAGAKAYFEAIRTVIQPLISR